MNDIHNDYKEIMMLNSYLSSIYTIHVYKTYRTQVIFSCLNKSKELLKKSRVMAAVPKLVLLLLSSDFLNFVGLLSCCS